MKKLLLVGMLFGVQLSYASQGHSKVKNEMGDTIILGTFGAGTVVIAAEMIYLGGLSMVSAMHGNRVGENVFTGVVAMASGAALAKVGTDAVRIAYYSIKK